MFYPDCGFQILKTASPNLVLFTIYKHLLSSAYPKTSLQLAHSVTHLSDTWQALSPQRQEQSVPCAHTCREFIHSCHPMLTPSFPQSLTPALEGLLPSSLSVWCLCFPTLLLISSHCPRLLKNENTVLRADFLLLSQAVHC